MQLIKYEIHIRYYDESHHVEGRDTGWFFRVKVIGNKPDWFPRFLEFAVDTTDAGLERLSSLNFWAITRKVGILARKAGKTYLFSGV